MKIEILRTADLRKIPIGVEMSFEFDNNKSILSARSLMYRLGITEGIKFRTTANYKNSQLFVVRES